MVKPKNIIDSSGWTWIFHNNKKTIEKQIDYPFNKEVEKLATSFYVSNIPNSVDAKGTWKICASDERLVDTFNANKLSKGDMFHTLPLFAYVTNGIAKPTVETSLTNANIRALVLDDQDLINVEDPSMVLLVKLKDVNSMSNMHVICRNEEFMELEIHHVGGLWIWIQFPSSSLADNFQTNASLKSVYSCIKSAIPSFKVDEHMTWIGLVSLYVLGDQMHTRK
ncbi:hypothetical protein Tco_1326820 [Tanacetum coccineum]